VEEGCGRRRESVEVSRMSVMVIVMVMVIVGILMNECFAFCTAYEMSKTDLDKFSIVSNV
jgi:hypothetical protein